MKIKSIIVSLALLTALNSYAENYFAFAEGGRGTANINADYSVNSLKSSNKNTAVSLGAGFIIQSHLILGIERTESATDNILGADDRYQINQNKLFAGYRFPIATHFRIVPMIGTTQWELHAKSGALIKSQNPKTGTYKGNEIYGQLNIEFPINHLVTVITSINDTHFKFGTNRSVQAGVLFEF